MYSKKHEFFRNPETHPCYLISLIIYQAIPYERYTICRSKFNFQIHQQYPTYRYDILSYVVVSNQYILHIQQNYYCISDRSNKELLVIEKTWQRSQVTSENKRCLIDRRTRKVVPISYQFDQVPIEHKRTRIISSTNM